MTNESPITRGVVLRVLVKAGLLFVVINLLYAWANPLPLLGQISIYNTLVPGRERLPFGENPASYNLSLFQLEAMFSSHEVSAAKPADEYRVLLIGDSSVWGILLEPEDMLASKLNDLDLGTVDGKTIRAYNLGYPTISVMKDLLILDRAMAYQPDLIVWLTTLEAMPTDKQTTSPIVQHNAEDARSLITRFDLPLDPDDPAFVEPSFFDRTVVGERRALADWLRLNVYGILWAATGIDQFYPDTYEPPQENLEASEAFYGLEPPLRREDLAFAVLEAASERAEGIPVLFVNEPMFISKGENSDIRYNFYYPRWAYDDYRRLMAAEAEANGWHYLDLWDSIPDSEFTNSAIHLTPAGEEQLAAAIADEILNLTER
jgi:hypothetical protein